MQISVGPSQLFWQKISTFSECQYCTESLQPLLLHLIYTPPPVVRASCMDVPQGRVRERGQLPSTCVQPGRSRQPNADSFGQVKSLQVRSWTGIGFKNKTYNSHDLCVALCLIWIDLIYSDGVLSLYNQYLLTRRLQKKFDLFKNHKGA